MQIPATPNPVPPPPVAPAAGSNPQADDIDSFIAKKKVMLTNSLLPAVWSKLQNRGYTQAVIQQKIAELDALSALNQAQRKEYGEQYQSTADYNAAEAEPHEDYEDHLGYARIVFRNNVAAKTGLGLKGSRHRSQSGYAAQALLFYNNLLGNAGWKAAMNAKGISDAELQAQQDAYLKLAEMEANKQKETGEAQGATATRDAFYDALLPWTQDFRATAKIALRRYPQLSEQIGIKDPS